ncbi:MAG: DUF4157 domain-containing protein [Melioribacteraceae bacterium]|nr:DUF4157 domain-containing protein [Melioribacteraceae bacterium]
MFEVSTSNKTTTSGTSINSNGKLINRKSLSDGANTLAKLISNSDVKSRIQTKLAIGKPGDRYEKEADDTADKVTSETLSSGSPSIQNKTNIETVSEQEEKKEEAQAKSISEEEEKIQTKSESEEERKEEKIQRKSKEEEKEINTMRESSISDEERDRKKKQNELRKQEKEEDEKIQTKSMNSTSDSAPADLESRLSSARGKGGPLPPSTRDLMEARMGADFSDVRVHTDSSDAEMSARLNAHAFTVGSDIYFNKGSYSPETTKGQKLIAHELTHVIQQGHARTSTNRNAKQLNNNTSTVEGSRFQPKSYAKKSSSSAVIQRGLWDDITGAVGTVWDATAGRLVDAAGNIIEMTGDLFWSLLERIAPQLVPLVREVADKGITGFIKDKLSEAVGHIFDGLRDGSDTISTIFPTFGKLFKRAVNIAEALASGNCKPMFAALNELKEIVTQLAGEAWQAIKDFFAPIGEFFSELWQSFGAPVMDWLGQTAKDVWEYIKNLGKQIWDWTQPVRDAIGGAWSWLKGKLGIGDSESSEGGIIQWIKDKAAEAWESIKEVLKPVIEPIQAFIEKVKAVLPLDAILNLRETIQKWLDKANAMGEAMAEDGSGVAEEQISLRDEILPAILQSIESVRTSLVNTGIWISEKIGAIGTSVTNFLTSLSNNSLLSKFSPAFAWLKNSITKLSEWAGSTVSSLFEMIGKGLIKLSKFIRPILDMLEQLFAVLKDLMGKLPDLILGPVWWMLPKCIKDPVKDFVLNQILKRIPFFNKLLEVGDIWEKIKSTALKILKQIFVDGNLFGALWTLFKAILNIFGLPPGLITNIIIKATQALGDILASPIDFIINVLKAVKQGFSQFFDHIFKHLFGGVTDWLFGQLEGAGITIPKDFSLKSILKLVFELLGITMERIWLKLEKKIGKSAVDKLKTVISVATGAWEWIKLAVEGGPGAVWEKLKEKLNDLWGQVLTGIVGWINTVIVVQASKWLLSLCDISGITPTITAIIAIYKAIESFMEYLKEMLEIINSVLNGIAEIAKGVIGKAAEFLEKALADSIPVAIGFLANQFGLGKLGKRISEIVGSVREKVDGAMDWLIDKAVDTGKAFLDMLKSGAAVVKESITNWWKARKELTTKDGEEHEIFFNGVDSSAPLTIESNPKPYLIYLDDIKKEHELTDDQINPAKTKATEIEKEKVRNVPGDQKKDQAVKINKLVEELAALTVALPLKIKEGKSAPPVYGPLYNGFGSFATVAFLEAPIKPEGSSPSVANTEDYDNINIRRQGSGSYYIKGHLLNDNLGGPGTTWNNLTPLSQQANSDHKTEFENPVKLAINDMTKGYASETKGKAENFSVKADYGREIPASLKLLEDTSTDELPDGVGDKDPFLLAKVMRSEQYVPYSLDCRADIEDKAGNKKSLNKTIPVEIQYGEPENYQLTATYKEKFILAEKAKGKTRKEAVSSYLAIKGLNEEMAGKIYDKLVSSKRIYNYLSLIGTTKKALEAQNPDKKIISGEYS